MKVLVTQNAIYWIFAILIVVFKLPFVTNNIPYSPLIWCGTSILAITYTFYQYFKFGRPIITLNIQRCFASLQISSVLLLFLFISALPLIFCHLDPYYSPIQRYIYFAIAILLLTPLISTIELFSLRRKIWYITQISIIGIVVCSIIIILFNPWSELFEIRHNFGLFSNGLGFSHMCALSMPLLISLYHKFPSRYSIPIAILIAAIFALQVSAGSRMGLIATSLFIIFSTILRPSKRIFSLFFLIILFCIVIIIFHNILGLSLWEIHTYKFKVAETAGSITFSRDALWHARINEFLSSPLIGIGIGQVQDFSHPFYSSEEVRLNTHCEPGNCLLALLAQTGIIGLILFLIYNYQILRPYISYLRIRCNSKNLPTESLLASFNKAIFSLSTLLGSYFILAVIGITEGYILAPGGLFFMTFWLLTSILIRKSE